jgi:hypothetical protein
MNPKIIIPFHISRTYIQRHTDWIFIYGQDYQERGMFGQSNAAYGEPNAFMVPTCRKMCKSNRYWSDSEYLEVCSYIDEAINKIPRDGRIIIPFPKIGMGASQMNYMAPKLFTYMNMKIDSIKHPNIIVNYGNT